MTVQYALNTSTIRPASLMEKIRIAGQTGYQGIELWNDDLTAHEQQGGSLADVRQALADYGLAVPTVIALHGWLGAEGTARAQALEEVRRRMAQAVAVGAEFIVASPPLDSCDLSRGGADYRELLEIGRGIGVRPAMEYLGFVQSVYTIDQAWQIATDADHSDASLIMDPFHILRGGGPYCEHCQGARRQDRGLALERCPRRQALCRTKRRRPGDAGRRSRAAARDRAAGASAGIRGVCVAGVVQSGVVGGRIRRMSPGSVWRRCGRISPLECMLFALKGRD